MASGEFTPIEGIHYSPVAGAELGRGILRIESEHPRTGDAAEAKALRTAETLIRSLPDQVNIRGIVGAMRLAVASGEQIKPATTRQR